METINIPIGQRERREIARYKDSIKDHPLLKKYKLELININTYKILLSMGVILLILIGCFIGGLFYLGITDRLGSTYENIINPFFNASVNVENDYTFNSSTLNTFEFKPNYTINVIVDGYTDGCNCS